VAEGRVEHRVADLDQRLAKVLVNARQPAQLGDRIIAVAVLPDRNRL
jgi:hypothetical protein